MINSWTVTLVIQQEIANQRKDLIQTAAGAEPTRNKRSGVITKSRHCVESSNCDIRHEEHEELQEEVETKRQEIECIQRDVGRMAADFPVKTSRLQSRIAKMEDENCRYLANLEDL